MSLRARCIVQSLAALFAACTLSYAQEGSALACDGEHLYAVVDGRLVEIDKESLAVARSLELDTKRPDGEGEDMAGGNTARGEGTEGRPPEVDAPLRREAVVLPAVTERGVRTNYADASAVRLPDGRYRMYANTFDQRLGSNRRARNARLVTAISPDGVRFELEAEIGFPGVATERIFPFEGGYRLYYPQHEGPRSCKRILSAFAKDGLEFAEESGVRIEPLARGNSVGGPTVYRLADGRYRMLFDEGREVSTPGAVVKADILGALSADGLAWTRDAEPVIDAGEDEIEAGQALHPCVQPWEGRYVLFYSVHGATRIALSEDGIRFERGGFLFRGADADAHVLEDGRIRVYYGDYREEEGGGIYVVHLTREEILRNGR